MGVKSVFESVDTDGSGLIDYSEFCAAAIKDGAVRCDKAISAAFRVFDIDGDGQISKAELGDVLMSQSEDLGEIDKLLDPWDSDGDGQLSFEEFRAMVLNLGQEMTSPTPPSQASSFAPSRAPSRAPADALQEGKYRITHL